MSRHSVARWTATLAAGALLLLTATVPASAANQPRPVNTEPKSGAGTATAQAPATLVLVEVAAHDTYDRVVFEYRNGIPAYEIAYGPVRQPGSGRPADLRGEHSLALTTRHTTGVRGGPLEGTATNWTFQLPSVVQVNYLGSFEGVGTAGIGVATESLVGFRVFTLSDPARLVIDIAHPATNPTPSTTAQTAQTSQPTTGDSQQPDSSQQAAPLPTQTAQGGIAAGNRTPPSGGAPDGGPAAWQLGLIGGIAAAALTAAIFVVRKLRSGVTG